MKNTQAQPTANDSSDIDFTTLPILEMASALRLIGQTLLFNLLYAEQQSDRPLPFQLKVGQNGQGQPDRLTSLLLQQTQMLAQLRAWESNCRRQRSRTILPSRWAAPPSSFEAIVRQAISGELSAQAVRNRLIAQIAHHFGNNSPLYTPDKLWQLAGEIAWREPHFQAEIGVLVKDYFHDRVLFTGGDMPTAILSPQTFWLLIVLTQKRNPFTRPRLNQEHRLVSEIIRQLQRIGQKQAMSSGWTGWWDQWVISETFRRWPIAFKKLDLKLNQALTTLPFLAMTEPDALTRDYGKQQGKTTAASSKLAKLNWEKDIPPWFHLYQSYESGDKKND